MEPPGDFANLRAAWDELSRGDQRDILKDVRSGRRTQVRADAAVAAWAGLRELRKQLSGLALALASNSGQLWLRRQLRRGIALNARFAAGEPVTGPPDMDEAERLLRVMDREGWLRYHLDRDGEAPARSAQG